MVTSIEKKSRIDAQWQALQPGWGNKDYAGERKMLHETLDDGENIERLSGGGWKVLIKSQVLESHDRGIAVATSLRVLLLNKGRLSKNARVIPYWTIKTVKETGPEEVSITGPGNGLGPETYETRLPAGEAAPFASLVQSRLLTDAASIKEAFSHLLDSEERIERWTRCSGGEETVGQQAKYDNQGRTEEGWWEVERLEESGLAIATDRRVLFATDSVAGDQLNVPYADLLTVTRLDRSVKFARRGRDRVYVIRPSRTEDAEEIANLMQNYLAAPGRPDQKRARILAEWQMQQPIWRHRGKHDKERIRLPEILDDGERLEGLLGGTYYSKEEGEMQYDGVVAATDRRLIFLSEGIFGKHAGQLLYEGISEIAYEKGRVHQELRFISNPGYNSYRVSSIDDERPYNTRQSGYAEEFALLVQGFLAHLTEPASASVATAGSKLSRINAQWQERSADWKLDTHKNEREKLFDILSDDENIERLIQGHYRADVKGTESHNVVIAATDRRIVFVYNGLFGEHLNELSYSDIERVEVKNGFLAARITVTGRAGVNNYVVNDVVDEGRDEFIDCLRSHLDSSL